MKEWLVTMTSTSLAASRARSTKHSADERALAAHALVGRDRHLPPGPLGDAGDELVAVAGVGGGRPLAQSDDLLAESADRGVDLTHREQAVLVVGEAALELVEAHVVATALDEGVRGTAPEDRSEGVGDARHVAVDDLCLQGERRGRDDGRLARLEGVGDRRHEVGERLAGAGAGLDEQVLPVVDRVRDGLGHLDLARPLRATDSRHRGVEEVVERGSLGHWVSVCRRTGAPPPWTPDLWTGAPSHPDTVGPNSRRGLADSGARYRPRELDRGMSAPLPTDLEIANAATLRPLPDVAADLGVRDDHLEPYGRGVAKIDLAVLDEPAPTHTAKYVVVTAVTPTPLGEGKTTTSVGLAQALHRLGKRAVVALRQPSMGPTFGIKGGAAGGGYSQVVPMERLNLHLTGDFHAVTSAHNLLAAMIDNHLHHGNELGIDVRNITWRRVLDVNDRALRNVVVGLGARQDGLARETGFDITAASEVMVLLTLATSLRRPPRAARADRRRLHRRGQERHRGGPARRRRDGGHPRGRPQAQPAPDPRGRPGHHPLRTVRQHRHRHVVRDRRPHRACAAATTPSPRRASAPTWAPSASSTSSAGSAGSSRTSRSSSPPSARSRPTRGGMPSEPASLFPRACSRRAPRTSRPACPTCASTSRSSGGSACSPSSRSTPSPTTTTPSTPSSGASATASGSVRP